MTCGWAAPPTRRHEPLARSANTHQAAAKRPRTPIACTPGVLSAASLTRASLKMKATTDADIARMPRVLSITCRSLAVGHLENAVPMLLVDRHDGQPRLAHQFELLELRIGLDGGQGHRMLDRLHRLDV